MPASLGAVLEPTAADSLTRRTLATARKGVVLTLGGTMVGVGVALLVLPGPGLLVIGVGVGLLATEFVWARRLLRRLRAQAAAAGLGGGDGTRDEAPGPTPDDGRRGA